MAASLSLELGQCQGCLASVPDLTTIPSHLCVGVPVVRGVFDNLVFVNLDFSALFLEAAPNHTDVESEDLQRGREVELGVMKTDVDTGCKRFVKVANTVGGEKQNSRVVFENSEEDCVLMSPL